MRYVKLPNSLSFRLSSKLSPREEAVKQLLLKGKSRKEMAKVLGIKPSTVCTHTLVVFEKEYVNSQTELMAKEIDTLRNKIACMSTNKREMSAA